MCRYAMPVAVSAAMRALLGASNVSSGSRMTSASDPPSHHGLALVSFPGQLEHLRVYETDALSGYGYTAAYIS